MDEQVPDFLWRNISSLPYFRGLLRAVEGRFYQTIKLIGPVLDLGCGDGHFTEATFEKPLDIGLDPWLRPLQEAQKRQIYGLNIFAEGACMPFDDQAFWSVISNSVLEHIPDLMPVLNEVARVIKPGGKFVFCVPNHQFDQSLSIGNWLDQVGLHRLSKKYRRWFERIARHHHLDSPEVWTRRLNEAGFEVIQWWHYFSPKSQAVMEWGHFLGLPSLVLRKLTGKWILMPTRRNLGIVYRLLQPYYLPSAECGNGVCTFYIAQRK